jgi:hypothetical protein
MSKHSERADRVARQGFAAIGCEGKKRFESAPLVQRVAKRRSRNDKNSDIYRCSLCSGWHIGSDGGGLRRRQRNERRRALEALKEQDL